MYSVELYKITCGEDIFMSHEDVFVNCTNNTVDPMEIYKVIITARNNVEGARNGTRVEMKGEWCHALYSAPEQVSRFFYKVACILIYMYY